MFHGVREAKYVVTGLRTIGSTMLLTSVTSNNEGTETCDDGLRTMQLIAMVDFVVPVNGKRQRQ